MKHYLKFLVILTLSTLNIAAEIAEEPSAEGTGSAIFAAGCFWCTQAAFDDLPGVISTTAGYTGGHTKDPTYKQVSHENTGHYEAVKVTFNPTIISYQKLLEVFWKNVDPVDDSGQFCDRGDSYRSAIFYSDDEQKSMALKSKKEVEEELKATVVTAIVPATKFYPAEDYHQEYHKKNPIRYKYYRYRCGRDNRLEEVWKNKG